jgi:hypothetical protein
MLTFGEHEGINADVKQLRDELVSFFVGGHDSKIRLKFRFTIFLKYFININLATSHHFIILQNTQ